MLKIKIPLWILVITMIATISIAVTATLMFTWDISNFVRVETDYSIAVYETDEVTECTSIDWGFLGIGESLTYEVRIKNVGNSIIWASWNSSNVPTGFTLTGEYFNVITGSFSTYNENVNVPLNGIDVGVIMPARLTLTNVNCGVGSYSFGIQIHSSDAL